MTPWLLLLAATAHAQDPDPAPPEDPVSDETTPAEAHLLDGDATADGEAPDPGSETDAAARPEPSEVPPPPPLEDAELETTAAEPMVEEATMEAEPTKAEARAEKLQRLNELNAERALRIYQQRSLANHAFITPMFGHSALPTTHLGGAFGASAVIQPKVTGDGTDVFAAATGDLEAGVRFGKWAGFDADVDGLAGFGQRATSDSEIRADAAWQFRGGVPIRLVHRPSTAFTLKPTGFYLSGSTLDFQRGLAAIQEQIAAGQEPDTTAASREMITNFQAYGGGLNLALAQAAGSAFGVQLTVGGGLEHLRVQDWEDDAQVIASGLAGRFQSDLALTFDLNPVPLGFMLEYQFDATFGAGDLKSTQYFLHDLGLGLYINGMMNTVGLEAVVQLDLPQITAGAQLVYRSYF